MIDRDKIGEKSEEEVERRLKKIELFDWDEIIRRKIKKLYVLLKNIFMLKLWEMKKNMLIVHIGCTFTFSNDFFFFSISLKLNTLILFYYFTYFY